MNPKFWGPHAWIFLHSITFNYPKEPTNKDKEIYVKFFKDLQFIIPCEKCAYHYKRHLEEYPIEDEPIKEGTSIEDMEPEPESGEPEADEPKKGSEVSDDIKDSLESDDPWMQRKKEE